MRCQSTKKRKYWRILRRSRPSSSTSLSTGASIESIKVHVWKSISISTFRKFPTPSWARRPKSSISPSLSHTCVSSALAVRSVSSMTLRQYCVQIQGFFAWLRAGSEVEVLMLIFQKPSYMNWLSNALSSSTAPLSCTIMTCVMATRQICRRRSTTGSSSSRLPSLNSIL